MRSSQWLLGLATTSAIVGAVASGCGGSTNSSGTTTDSGTAADVTTHPEAAAEAAVEAAPPQDAGSEACAVDASLTSLDVPDAAIGDSGATTSSCYSCIETTCGAELTACGEDCSCKSDAVTLITCIGSGAGVTSCATPLLTGGADTTTDLLLACLAGQQSGFGTGPGCLTQCGVTLPGGGDGGGKEAGGEGGSSEGGGDAALDAPEQ